MDVWRKLREFVQHVVRYIVHVPLKTFALHTLFEQQLFRNVSVIEQSCQRLPSVEIFFVLIVEPRLDHALVILCKFVQFFIENCS